MSPFDRYPPRELPNSLKHSPRDRQASTRFNFSWIGGIAQRIRNALNQRTEEEVRSIERQSEVAMRDSIQNYVSRSRPSDVAYESDDFMNMEPVDQLKKDLAADTADSTPLNNHAVGQLYNTEDLKSQSSSSSDEELGQQARLSGEDLDEADDVDEVDEVDELDYELDDMDGVDYEFDDAEPKDNDLESIGENNIPETNETQAAGHDAVDQHVTDSKLDEDLESNVYNEEENPLPEDDDEEKNYYDSIPGDDRTPSDYDSGGEVVELSDHEAHEYNPELSSMSVWQENGFESYERPVSDLDSDQPDSPGNPENENFEAENGKPQQIVEHSPQLGIQEPTHLETHQDDNRDTYASDVHSISQNTHQDSHKNTMTTVDASRSGYGSTSMPIERYLGFSFGPDQGEANNSSEVTGDVADPKFDEAHDVSKKFDNSSISSEFNEDKQQKDNLGTFPTQESENGREYELGHQDEPHNPHQNDSDLNPEKVNETPQYTPTVTVREEPERPIAFGKWNLFNVGFSVAPSNSEADERMAEVRNVNQHDSLENEENFRNDDVDFDEEFNILAQTAHRLISSSSLFGGAAPAPKHKPQSINLDILPAEQPESPLKESNRITTTAHALFSESPLFGGAPRKRGRHEVAEEDQEVDNEEEEEEKEDQRDHENKIENETMSENDNGNKHLNGEEGSEEANEQPKTELQPGTSSASNAHTGSNEDDAEVQETPQEKVSAGRSRRTRKSSAAADADSKEKPTNKQTTNGAAKTRKIPERRRPVTRTMLRAMEKEKAEQELARRLNSESGKTESEANSTDDTSESKSTEELPPRKRRSRKR